MSVGQAGATIVSDPLSAALPNQALNHAASAVEAAAAIAIAATAAIQQGSFTRAPVKASSWKLQIYFATR